MLQPPVLSWYSHIEMMYSFEFFLPVDLCHVSTFPSFLDMDVLEAHVQCFGENCAKHAQDVYL